MNAQPAATSPAPSMTLAQAHDIADQASPMPHLARHALACFRQALEDGEQSRAHTLETVMRLLMQLRSAAGVPGNCPLSDMPAAISAIRRRAFPERVAVSMCERAIELCPPQERTAGVAHYAMAWLSAWRQAVEESQQ